MRAAVATTSLDAYSSFSTTDLQRKKREVMTEFATCPGLSVAREQLAEKVLEEIDGGKTRSGRPAKLLRLPVKGQGDLFN